MREKNTLLGLILGASLLTGCINEERSTGILTDIKETKKPITHYNYFGDETKKDTISYYQAIVEKNGYKYQIDLKGTEYIKKEILNKKISDLKNAIGKPVSYVERIGVDQFISDYNHKGFNYLNDFKIE